MDSFAQRILASTEVTAAPLTSEAVKQYFAKNGIRVNVRDFGSFFRLAALPKDPDFNKEQMNRLGAQLGFTGADGKPGFAFVNGLREVQGQKPGAHKWKKPALPDWTKKNR